MLTYMYNDNIFNLIKSQCRDLIQINSNYSAHADVYITLYDPPPFRFFALTPLILELQYCALGTFSKK